MEREGSRRTRHSSGARDSGLNTAEIERKSVSNVTFQSLNSCRSLVNARCSLSRRSLFMLSFISPSIHPFGSRFSVADPLFFKPLSGSLSYCSVATAIRNKKVQAYNFQRKIEGERNELGQSSFRAGILMLHSLLLALRYVSVVNRSCLQDSSCWKPFSFRVHESRAFRSFF